ncbi:MAG: choice-of-anchor D domain-containing protein [Bryobacterales bacterium]|nr:choice-of-anchor D domain-containing protein [Bryobacterales bacterium]
MLYRAKRGQGIATTLLLLCAVFFPSGLFAQLGVFAVEETGERAIRAQYSVGSIAATDTLTATFRVRNTPAVTVLSVAGSGFSLSSAPLLPQAVNQDGFVEFSVRFAPTGPGQYSAALRVNTFTAFLLATAVAVANVYVEADGARSPINPGQPIAFGALERDRSTTRAVVLENAGSQPLTVSAISVSGASYRFSAAPVLPLTLGAGETSRLEITFEPRAIGLREGSLTVDGRRFGLTGTGVEPSLPRPRIALPGVLAVESGKQITFAVRFDEAPRTSGKGVVRLSLGKQDPGLIFTSTSSPSVEFSIVEGERLARFGSRTEAVFQTGTTAGNLVLTAEVAGVADQLSLLVPGVAVVIDTAKGARTAAGLEVQITGFDNTRTVSQLSFSFIDRAGRPVNPSPIRYDGTAGFKTYFDAQAPGGLFSLKAAFPVSGDPSQIDAVDVEILNREGVARAERVRF